MINDDGQQTEFCKYTKYMKMCLELAKMSEGQVSPNPLVGAVVLDKNDEIVGKGRHEHYGAAHAEVNALEQAGEKAVGGTLIVNLEPCSHYGKTPPCADLVIKKGIKKLVVGMIDPNPKVSSKGVQKCKDAGIEVILNVLENDCRELNEVFIKNQMENKPFVAIKTATTSDGKIATAVGDSKWITNEKSRKYVHSLRNKYDAILTSANTVLADNPQMTCRIRNGRNPIRVIVDSDLRCSKDFRIFDNNCSKIFVAVKQSVDEKKIKQFHPYVNFIKCPIADGKIDLVYLMDKLYENGICSILVESGGILNGSFLKNNLVDKVYQFIAPKLLGDVNAKSWAEGLFLSKMDDCLKFQLLKNKLFDDDILLEWAVYKDFSLQDKILNY